MEDVKEQGEVHGKNRMRFTVSILVLMEDVKERTKTRKYGY